MLSEKEIIEYQKLLQQETNKHISREELLENAQKLADLYWIVYCKPFSPEESSQIKAYLKNNNITINQKEWKNQKKT